MIRSVISLSLFVLAISTNAQTHKEQFNQTPQDATLERNLNTVLEARLREYNSRSSQPMSSDESRARIAAFERAIKDFSGDSKGDWVQLSFEVFKMQCRGRCA